MRSEKTGADERQPGTTRLIGALEASDLADGLLRQARHLHVASYFLRTKLQPGIPGLFQRAHALGLTTSLDTNYDPSEQWLGIDELLAGTDVFLPNRTEALSITQYPDVQAAARQLAKQARLVAVKLGPEGAIAYGRDGLATSDSIRVDVVDTVGAGDSFDAGFSLWFPESVGAAKVPAPGLYAGLYPPGRREAQTPSPHSKRQCAMFLDEILAAQKRGEARGSPLFVHRIPT